MSFGEPKSDASYLTTELESAVLTLRMVDEGSKNGLSIEMVSALLAGFERAAQPDVSCVVLGGLPSVFCSGATKEILAALLEDHIAPTELGLGKIILECPVPVVASCQGWAVGGGFALALACDFVILAEERRYGFNFMDLGITPGMGSTILAERFLGPAHAQELLFSGELRRGRDFGTTGINHVVPADSVEERALDLAVRIAEKPRENVELLKRHVSAERLQKMEDALTKEAEMHSVSLKHINLENFGGTRD